MPMFMRYQKYVDKDTIPQVQEELQRFLHVPYCWNFTVLQGIDSAHTNTYYLFWHCVCAHK